MASLQDVIKQIRTEISDIKLQVDTVNCKQTDTANLKLNYTEFCSKTNENLLTLNKKIETLQNILTNIQKQLSF